MYIQINTREINICRLSKNQLDINLYASLRSSANLWHLCDAPHSCVILSGKSSTQSSFLSFILSFFSANTVISFRVFTCPLPLGLSLRNVIYTTFFIPSQWLSVLAVKWLVRFIPVFAVKGGKEKADFSLSGFIGVYEKATWYLVPWTSITKACNPWHNALWLVKKTRVTLSTIRYNCFILF